MIQPDTVLTAACALVDGPSIRAYAEAALKAGSAERAFEATNVLAAAIGLTALARDIGIPRERLCAAFAGAPHYDGPTPREVLLAIACGRMPSTKHT